MDDVRIKVKYAGSDESDVFFASALNAVEICQALKKMGHQADIMSSYQANEWLQIKADREFDLANAQVEAMLKTNNFERLQ